MNKFIVAEIGKNWPEKGQALEGILISQQFEQVIEVNRRRGYRLISFQFAQLAKGRTLIETIIAVFERE